MFGYTLRLDSFRTSPGAAGCPGEQHCGDCWSGHHRLGRLDLSHSKSEEIMDINEINSLIDRVDVLKVTPDNAFNGQKRWSIGEFIFRLSWPPEMGREPYFSHGSYETITDCLYSAAAVVQFERTKLK